jgi:hypothetical protein
VLARDQAEKAISCLGESERLMSSSSANKTIAASLSIPRGAIRESNTGAGDHSGKARIR